jgi:hypothetical protein
MQSTGNPALRGLAATAANEKNGNPPRSLLNAFIELADTYNLLLTASEVIFTVCGRTRFFSPSRLRLYCAIHILRANTVKIVQWCPDSSLEVLIYVL